MDRNFARALALVLKSEGGWSDNPADPGGATMKGVTLANFRRYVKANATKADLRMIGDAQLATIFRRYYWDAVLGAELPDGVDHAVFDFAVNSGPGRAAKTLQAALGVAQDGRIGPATLAAARAKPAGVTIDALCDARLAFLERLPTWATFGRGWSDRVTSVRAQALLMSAAPVTAPAPVPAASSPGVEKPAGGAPAAQPVPPAVKTAAAAGILVLIAGALAALREHVTDLFGSLF
ncbi:glycoside hydrolase family 108 protein [Mesorhizobium sangaii]|uniref:Lysozyme family protein n=1 Tax=Mesorhizobium sangaii TaxID=505389 RepID=A0A841PEK0_9HYPH|nr:glycoside hydrolase family 108 protein [Mesorhizobium sangaii]MBB6412201.1 lysozyme family protein [Mesorhizobium sangaii]